MTYYTVWYIERGIRKIWATGLTLDEARAAVNVLMHEFGFTAGIEEE